MSPTARRAATAAALVAIVLAGAAARLAGLDFLLPQMPEPDAHVVRQVELLRGAVEDPVADINWGKYPHLVAWVAWVASAVPIGEGPAPPGDLAAHLARAALPTVRVRAVVALLSLLAIPATYALARRFLARPPALYAAALVSLSLLHVTFSQQARPHAPATACIVLAVAACVFLRRRPDLAGYAAAALACGAAVASLQTGLAVLLPLAAAHVLRARDPGPDAAPAWRAWALLGAALALLALVFRLSWPFLFARSTGMDAAQLEPRGQGLWMQAGHVIGFSLFRDGGLQRVLWTLWSYEPVALVLAAAGLGAVAAGHLRARRGAPPAVPGPRPPGAASRARDLAVVLAFAVPYLVVLAAYQRTYERLVLPLVPFVAILAGRGLAALLDARPRGVPARVARGALVALALALPAASAAWLARVRAAPDTTDQAARWLEAHAGPGDVVVLPRALGLPLFPGDAALASSRDALRTALPTWTGYLLEHPGVRGDERGHELRYLPLRRSRDLKQALADPANFLRATGARFLLFEDYTARVRDPVMTALYAALPELANPVARFAPYRDAERATGGPRRAWPLTYQDLATGPVPHFLARLAAAERCGPVIEVWRVRAP